jgi:hypothetical protein
MAIAKCCDWETDAWSATQGLAPWPLLNVVTWRQMFHGHRWMKCYPGSIPMAITYWMLWVDDRFPLGIDEWSATQGPVLWALLNAVTGRLMFHGHRWMKRYTGTSPMAITECCEWKTDVPWASMDEVLPQHYSYGHYWMLWLGDRCSTGINEWSATQGPAPWPLLNVVSWKQLFHGHRWMKCYRVTTPMAITECCELKTDVPWTSMNEGVIYSWYYPIPLCYKSYVKRCDNVVLARANNVVTTFLLMLPQRFCNLSLLAGWRQI